MMSYRRSEPKEEPRLLVSVEHLLSQFEVLVFVFSTRGGGERRGGRYGGWGGGWEGPRLKRHC